VRCIGKESGHPFIITNRERVDLLWKYGGLGLGLVAGVVLVVIILLGIAYALWMNGR
jgi:hypothetical protein